MNTGISFMAILILGALGVALIGLVVAVVVGIARRGGSAHPRLIGCPQCGRNMLPGAATCPNCGKAMT